MSIVVSRFLFLFPVFCSLSSVGLLFRSVGATGTFFHARDLYASICLRETGWPNGLSPYAGRRMPGTERKRTVPECRRRNARSILACVSRPVSVAGPCRLRLAGIRPRGKRNCRSRRDGSLRAVPGCDFITRDERAGHEEPSFASDLCGGQEGIRGVCVFPTRSAGDASPFRSETKENRSGKRSGLRTTILPGISVGNYSVMTKISSAGAAA